MFSTCIHACWFLLYFNVDRVDFHKNMYCSIYMYDVSNKGIDQTSPMVKLTVAINIFVITRQMHFDSFFSFIICLRYFQILCQVIYTLCASIFCNEFFRRKCMLLISRYAVFRRGVIKSL